MMTVKGGEFQQEITSGKLLFLHQRNIINALRTHGPEVTTELKRVVSTGPRSGRVYTYRGRKYRASAPGEPPAKRSGKLAKSFVYKSTSYRQLLIGNTARSKKGFPYPGYLEPDYFESSLERPYFLVTINRLSPRLQADLMKL